MRSSWKLGTWWPKSIHKSLCKAERWSLQHGTLVLCVNGVGGREEPLRLLVFATARWLHDKQLDKVLKSRRRGWQEKEKGGHNCTGK